MLSLSLDHNSQVTVHGLDTLRADHQSRGVGHSLHEPSWEHDDHRRRYRLVGSEVKDYVVALADYRDSDLEVVYQVLVCSEPRPGG